MIRSPNLKLVLALVMSVLAFGLTGSVALVIGEAGVSGIEDGAGKSLALLADQMQDKLDRRAFERLREIRNTAQVLGTLGIAGKPDAAGALLEQIRGSGDDYAWLAFVNGAGVVVETAGKHPSGDDISQRPWFRAALGDTVSGEAGDTLQKAGATIFSIEAGRSLYIAHPVLGANGEPLGALVAQINGNWVSEIRDSVMNSLKRDYGVDILVLNSSGAVILGPAEMLGRTLAVAEFAMPMAQDHVFEGRRYLFAYAKTDGYQDFTGLGWSVLVRQDARIALAQGRKLQSEMILWGLVFSVIAAIAAWIVAGRIASPLLRLARTAQSIQAGADMQMPRVHSYAEVEVLSRSFDLLVSDLKERERALANLNESLEAQIAERTGELAARNQALAMAYAEAEIATRAKSRFLAAASHDLRQPLHAMSLFARALSRRVSSVEATRLVAQLEEALGSLRDMFEALLNISRLDAGMIQPNMAEMSISALVERVSHGFRAEAESRGLRFHSRSIDAAIRTDPALLEAMLRNLLSNALKFTRRGGIALIAHRSGSGMAFEIVDTGPGIARERRERIFDEFERSREQAFGHNEGLGLGLSIVRRYAALLDMKVGLASRPGRGTRFTLTAPSLTIMDRQDAEGSTPALPAKGACRLPPGLRLLVLDDDPMIVAALMQDLTDRGCKVEGATSPAQAEALLDAGDDIDAMILDFDLGCGETGLEFYTRMERRLPRRVAGLLLTGGTDTAVLATIAAGRLPWLTKPADPNMIAQALARTIFPERSGAS